MEGAPHSGKQLRGGAAEVQLGLWPGRHSCGCLLQQPTHQVCSCVLPPLRWVMARTWLLLLLALGCPALPTGELPLYIPSVPQLVSPSLFPCPGLLVCEWDAGMKDRDTWGPLGEGLTRRSLSLPCCTLPPSYWGPKSSSPGVRSVGREGSHLLEV